MPTSLTDNLTAADIDLSGYPTSDASSTFETDGEGPNFEPEASLHHIKAGHEILEKLATG